MIKKKETLINFETAKLAEKVDYPVFDHYNKFGVYNKITGTEITYGKAIKEPIKNLCGRPTLTVLKDWLREEKGIHIETFLEDNEPFIHYYCVVRKIGSPFPLNNDLDNISEDHDWIIENTIQTILKEEL